MPKGKRVSEQLKADVLRDYYAGVKTTTQIAAEYGIDRRRIYNWRDETKFRPRNIPPMKFTRLTLDEAELVLLMILECDSILTGKQRITMKTLEDKMLNVSEYLTELERAAELN